MRTASRGLAGWFALAVVLVGINTLVQIQRSPGSPGHTQVDGFVRVVLFASFLIGLLVVVKMGWMDAVEALTFGIIKSEKPMADSAVVTFQIPVTDDGNRMAANIVATELVLVGLGLLAAGGAAGWAMLNGGGFTLLSTVTFLVAGLSAYLAIPLAVRRMSDSGRTWQLEITFTPVGMSQPVGDGQKTVAWTSITGFVFDRHRGGRRADVHVAISDDRGRRQLLPLFAKESPHGFLMTTAMEISEAERAEVVIERFLPGSVEWTDQRVRRGGFGLMKPIGSAVMRWPERPVQTDRSSGPKTFIDAESRSKTVRKGVAAWSVAAVLVLAVLTVIRHADALADGLRFLAVVGILLALSGVLAGYITGWPVIAGWFMFRRPKIPEPKPLPADVVEFGIPDNLKFVTRHLFAGLNGLGLIVLGGGMVVVSERAGVSDRSPIVLGTMTFLIGLLLLGAIAFRHREAAKSIPVSVADNGLQQPAAGGELLVLAWNEVKEVVLDEHIVGGRFSIHLALSDSEAVVLLHDEFRRKSRFGYLLTPTMSVVETQRFAARIDSLCPGLARWPARDIERSGLGIVASVRRTALRWKAGTTPRPPSHDGLVISKVVDSDKQSLRRENQFIRELVLNSRWITVATLTSRTISWSVRWSDIEKVVLCRIPDTDMFHLVLRPAKQVDAYYPPERHALQLGMKREPNGDIVIAETELTTEDVKQSWPVLREHTDVAFVTEGIDDPDHLVGQKWIGEMN